MLAQFQYAATSSEKGTLWEGSVKKCYGVRPFMRSKILTRALYSPYNFVCEFKCEPELMSYVYRGSSGSTEDELGFHQTKKNFRAQENAQKRKSSSVWVICIKASVRKLLSSLLRSGKGVNKKKM